MEEEKGKARLPEYDFMRVVAMLFVIGVHTMANMTFTGGAQLLYQNVAQSVLFTCNGLFFAISGRFALVPTQNLGRYYAKKLIYLGVPVLFFFFLRTMVLLGPSLVLSGLVRPGQAVRQFLVNVLGGLKGTEYWFLFFLAGNLAAAPLLARAFQEASPRTCALFLGLSMAYHGISLAAQALGLSFGYEYLFGGWSFYFYIGVCAERCLPSNRLGWLWVGAGVCLVLNTLVKALGLTNGAHDLSPLFTGITLGMYFLLRRLGCKCTGPRCRKIIGFLAGHSLSVYLVHTMVMQAMLSRLDLGPLLSGSFIPLRHLLFLLAVLIPSVAIAAGVDCLLLRPITGLLYRLTQRPVKS